MTGALVYLVEDEPAQVEVLSYNLTREAFSVVVARDGEQALLLVEEMVPDLIILDWMLPDISGIEICRQLRAKPNTKRIPILMLTARGEESDRIRGLETGADDYVVKPYSPSEIIARVRALLRRSRPDLVEERLELAGIEIDLARHRVSRDGEKVHLGPTEYRLLKALMDRGGRVLTRAQLLDLAWGWDVHVEERTVDVHIRRLRKALGADNEDNPIRTVRGVGYAFEPPS
jgi:two-component system phosphate regulon response regulator PhoB